MALYTRQNLNFIRKPRARVWMDSKKKRFIAVIKGGKHGLVLELLMEKIDLDRRKKKARINKVIKMNLKINIDV